MIIIFWISILMLFYTYIGYPIYVFVRAKRYKNAVLKDADFRPKVSVIMSAYNEGSYIEKKIKNLLESSYPKDDLETLVGSDGSTDATDQILSRMADKRVKVFCYKDRRGKPSVLNDLVLQATGEILVFCDVRQLFEKSAISELVSNFSDENIGCVSGELIFKSLAQDTEIAKGVGAYWDYEKFIRRCESAVHSMVGATGAIYAIRKALYLPVPSDIVLDDVYIPLNISRMGYRTILDQDAKAYDRPAMETSEEYRRKVRTLAGNYQIFSMFKDLLVPFLRPVSLALVSHKLFRVIAPFFMISVFVSNLFMAMEGSYILFLMAQIAFYALAIVGALTCRQKNKKFVIKIASTAYIFCFLNFTAIVGLYRFLSGKQKIAWERSEVRG
ncbi:MAG: glycosyltransferase family 2 protein [Candidatus Omnitrophota bacterium]|nr:glycosyltransferase family 2 protein [Candidatus Omnitrophota bacterium]